MSRPLHIDCFAGAAGDMFLGLLVDLGADVALLSALPERLGLAGVEVRAEKVARGPLVATKVHVVVRGDEEPPASMDHDHDHDHHHDHDHDHHAHDGHDHDHAHDPEAHAHGRNLREFLAALERAALPPRAAALARRAAELLYAAESAVHGRPVDEIHLHEAGADDALVDIAGTCLAIDALDAAPITCGVPLPVGGGRIRCAHGLLPVPVPAVVELLRGVALEAGPVAAETITPTGAALLRAVVDEFRPLPPLALERIGHGAGGRDNPDVPNVLRGLLGRDEPGGPRTRRVAVLETALDDALPQDLPVLLERLLAEGARDAFLTPVLMKKGRPGQLLTVICDPADASRLGELVLRESPALGIRARIDDRLEWDRESVAVTTPWGTVHVKRALDGKGRVVRAAPEFEDCRRAAQRGGVDVDTVRRRARAEHDAQGGSDTPPERTR